ncbi:hypothetical protein PWT90_02534 [Aphanocladium album]|nr:hypothetical protein PWT90_02534 [Aphanocladium album]
MASLNDQVFWRSDGHMRDFTLKFEEIIFSLALSSCVVIVSPWACRYYFQRPACLRMSMLLYAKLVFAATISAAQISNVAIWTTTAANHRTSTTILAAVVDLAASFATGLLIYTEHLYSVRSSPLFGTYLLADLLTDVLRSRSYFLRDGLDAVGNLAAACVMLKLILLGLRKSSKTSLIIDEKLRDEARQESNTGLLNELWLSTLHVLPPGSGNKPFEELGGEYSPETLSEQLSSHWSQWQHPQQPSRYSLLAACVRAWKFRFLTLIILRMTLTVLKFSQPFILHHIIGFVGRENDGSVDPKFPYQLFCVAIFAFYGSVLSRSLFARQMNGTVARIRGSVLALAFQKQHRLTEAQARTAVETSLMTKDIDGIATDIPRLFELPASLLEIGFGIHALSKVTNVSIWTVVGPVSLTTITTYLIRRWMEHLFASWERSIAHRVAKTSQILSQITVIKALGLGRPVAAYLQQLRVDEIRSSIAYRRVHAVSMAPLVLNDLIAPVAVIGVALFEGSLGSRMEASTVFPILATVSLIQQPLLALPQSFLTSSGVLGCFARIQSFLCLPDKKDCRAASDPARISAIAQQSNAAIQFHNADIAPYGKTEALLRGVNFRISAGSITTVIGLPGSGKSTILQGILGNIEVLDGSINVNTTDIAYCGQVVWLRDTSIRDNIICHRPYNRAKFRRVVRACFLEDDLQWLPGGENFVVGANGANLSNGQRQRIAIARTAYAECAVTLLDDAFSSLDSDTAITILYQLCGNNGLFRRAGCTALVVTYLPQCMEVADQAIYLDSLGTATLRTMQQLSQYTDSLMAALGTVNRNVPATQETRELGNVRRCLDAGSESNVGDAELRQRDNITLLSMFVRAMGWMSSIIHALLLFSSAGLEVVPEIYIRFWIENHPDDTSLFVGYSLVIVAASVTAVLHYLLLYTRLGPRASASLHKDLVRSTLGSKIEFLSTAKVSNIVTLYNKDMTIVSRDLLAAHLGLIYAASNSAINIGIVLTGAKYLYGMAPALGYALFHIQDYYRCLCGQLRDQDLQMKATLPAHFEETAAGLTHIQALQLEEKNIQHGFALIKKSQSPFAAVLAIEQWLRLVLGLLVASLGTTLTAIAIFARGNSSQSAIGLSFMGLIYLGTALEMTIDAYTRLEACFEVLKRIFSFTEQTPQEAFACQNLLPDNWPSAGRIELTNVSAYYSRTNHARPALRSISLSIEPGQRIGVEGRSGSGKTNLLLAILGFLEYDGRIRIDGIDVSSINCEELRSRLITITQDQVLFDADVRTNLLPLSLGSVKKAAIDVAKAAERDLELEHLLKDLHIWTALAKKSGLETILDDAGYSKGQLQLLCIARAILKHRDTGYKVILVDEPLGNVDSATEETVRRVMRDYFVGCTVLTVARQHSDLGDVDEFVQLRRGAFIALDRERTDSDSSEDEL